MSKFKLLLCIGIIFTGAQLFSQNTVSGKVLNWADVPLAGLELSDESGRAVCSTDANGQFLIKLTEDTPGSLYLKMPGQKPYPIKTDRPVRMIIRYEQEGTLNTEILE